MRAGRLVFAGALAELPQRQQSACLRVGLNAPPPVTELARLPGVARVEELGGGQFRLHHAAGAAPHAALLEQARAGDWEVWELTPEQASLEQIFVELTLEREIAE
jgi:ABC-2 type transport system ATP-binding protein